MPPIPSLLLRFSFCHKVSTRTFCSEPLLFSFFFNLESSGSSAPSYFVSSNGLLQSQNLLTWETPSCHYQVRPGVSIKYGKDTNGLTRRGIDPHVSQEGALARIGLVTGGTSLEWPYHTLLVVSSAIGLIDERVANVWKQGSSENDGWSDVYDHLEFKIISNCCYPNCCPTNCSNFGN